MGRRKTFAASIHFGLQGLLQYVTSFGIFHIAFVGFARRQERELEISSLCNKIALQITTAR